MLIRKMFSLQKLTIYICQWHTVYTPHAPVVLWEKVLIVAINSREDANIWWISGEFLNLEKVFHVFV